MRRLIVLTSAAIHSEIFLEYLVYLRQLAVDLA